MLRPGIMALISFVCAVQRRSFLLDFGCVAEHGVEVGIESGEEKKREAVRSEFGRRRHERGVRPAWLALRLDIAALCCKTARIRIK